MGSLRSQVPSPVVRRMSRSANARSADLSASSGWAGVSPLAALQLQKGIVSSLETGPHQRLEALLLDRLAGDQGMARTQEKREVFGGDVQVASV